MADSNINVGDEAEAQVRFLGQLSGFVDELRSGLSQVDFYNGLAVSENPDDPTAQEYRNVIVGSDQTAEVIGASSSVMDDNGQGGHQALQGFDVAGESAAQMAGSFEPTER